MAAAEPARLAQMRARLDALNAEQSAPLWPSLVSAPIYVDTHALEERDADDTYVLWSN